MYVYQEITDQFTLENDRNRPRVVPFRKNNMSNTMMVICIETDCLRGVNTNAVAQVFICDSVVSA